jgi:hypothetical protein
MQKSGSLSSSLSCGLSFLQTGAYINILGTADNSLPGEVEANPTLVESRDDPEYIEGTLKVICLIVRQAAPASMRTTKSCSS